MTVTKISALGLLVAASLAVTASGQRSQEQLIASREAKLASDWLKLADWHLDYDEARAEAKKTGKPIFTYFTRSYSP